MFVVPIASDSIETANGIKFIVLGYAVLKEHPAVYVDNGSTTVSIPFSEICTINGTTVTLNGGKVFEAFTKIERSINLPQKNDSIKFGEQALKVKSIKINQHGELSKGMVVRCEDTSSKEPVIIRLANIEQLERANGDSEFSRSKFRATYKEYMGI